MLMSTTQWNHMNPVFEVADIDRSLAFYRDVLGLTPYFRWQDNAAGLYTESLELYLARTEHPAPSRVAVFVDDADAALEQYRAAGAEIATDIETMPWGLRGFTVRDPDGNLVGVWHEVERRDSLAAAQHRKADRSRR
jgi:catechol 2,3-dioxygenase-like lactoylglutathione lyase family enzyme